jgi:alpha-1,3-glucosyltransferase
MGKGIFLRCQAVYSFLDRVLLKLSGIFFGYTSESAGHLTRGLVGDTSFAILPEITPLIALILTVSSQLVTCRLIIAYFIQAMD